MTTTIRITDFLTTAEAAKRLGVTTETLQKYCLNSETGGTPMIHAVRVGRSWLVPKTEVARYRKERKRPGRPASA